MNSVIKYLTLLLCLFIGACSLSTDEPVQTCKRIDGTWNFSGTTVSNPRNLFFPDIIKTQLNITQKDCMINIVDTGGLLTSDGSIDQNNMIYSGSRTELDGVYHLSFDIHAQASTDTLKGECSYMIIDKQYNLKASGKVSFIATKAILK